MKQAILSLLLLVCTTFFFQAPAQQSRLDSAIHLLSEVKLANCLDTVKFDEARRLIRSLVLSDEDIEKLEAAAEKLDTKDNQDISYIIKLGISYALTHNNETKRSIAYGQKNIQELESYKGPHSSWFKDIFLRHMRIPFRNSERMEEGIRFYSQKIFEAKPRKDSSTLSASHFVLGGFYSIIGLHDQAIYNMQKSLSLKDTVRKKDSRYFDLINPIGRRAWRDRLNSLAAIYFEANDLTKALECYSLLEKNGESFSLFQMARVLLHLDSLEAVPSLLVAAKKQALEIQNFPSIAAILQSEALYHIKTGSFDKAEELLNESWKLIRKHTIPVFSSGTLAPDYYLALLYSEQGSYQKAIPFLEKNIYRIANSRTELLKNYRFLAELHRKTGNEALANEALLDFINLQENILQEQARFSKSSFELEQEMSAKELAINQLENENRIAGLTRNFTIALAFLLFLLVLLAYTRYRSKQRDNKLLAKTLSDLKSTQAQLIQSEKMASLGELTAGIAHEIQNPLNFVNNFSEVSTELLDEVRETRNKRQETRQRTEDDEIEDEILEDIKQNLKKITLHGKRADAIVKGMLEHSKRGSGQKELTDINALAEEFLRLSYQSYLAKDKDFSAELQLNLDPDLPKISVIPQDIGKVLVNLYNNAFYAVAERSRSPVSEPSKGSEPLEGYKPLVKVSTKTLGDKIEISVSDNGPGIPDSIKDKIFQPFFTTKPTGQGTGLGLSLSYDIVKAHGGTINVNTSNKGSIFTIII